MVTNYKSPKPLGQKVLLPHWNPTDIAINARRLYGTKMSTSAVQALTFGDDYWHF